MGRRGGVSGLKAAGFLDSLSTQRILRQFTRGRMAVAVFKRDDGDPSRNHVSSVLSIPAINAVTTTPRAATMLSAGTAGGVFKSTNGASSWRRVNAGLPSPGVNALPINPLTPPSLY